MPLGSLDTTQTWLWILKILMIILVGIAGFAARSEYQFVVKHPELLQSPPYNSHVELAHFLTYVGVCNLPFCHCSI